MIWIVVSGLAVWSFIQHQRLSDLSQKLAQLRLELLRRREEDIHVRSEATAPSPAVPLATPSPVVVSAVAQPQSASPEPDVPRTSRGIPAPPPLGVTTRTATPSLSDWLSENGLAWIGGGALALGGLMLVAYAVQRGVFTPMLRIWAAVALGVAALGVGEWLRGARPDDGRPPQLVAALTTAAGAAILYAAIWAAHVLYGFIPGAVAALLLTLVSLGLLGLALRHGEALGLLAVAAGYAVPLVTGGAPWSGAALDAFICLILATGAATTGIRAWGKVGALSLVCGGAWALGRAFSGDPAGAAAISLIATAAAMSALALARLRRAEDPSLEIIEHLPTATMVGASVIALILAGSASNAQAANFTSLMIIGLALLVAVGQWRKLLNPYSLAAPATAAILAALLIVGHDDAAHLNWLLASLLTVALAGLSGVPLGDTRSSSGLIGAAAPALALTILNAFSTSAHSHAGIMDLAFAGLFAAGVLVIHRSANEAPSKAIVRAAWIAASAEATGLALHARVDGLWAPTAYGLLGIVLAGFSNRLRWRGFAESAAVACVAGFAALLGKSEAGAAFAGSETWVVIALVAVGAALAQAGVWWLLRRRNSGLDSATAASTLAVLSALMGAFLVLQRCSLPASGGALMDAFTTASLRTILILAAGLTLSLRPGVTSLARWRGPTFLALGCIHGLVCQATVLHPWWGAASAVKGPPLIDGIALAFLAPALLLGAASLILCRSVAIVMRLAFVGAGLFLALWIVTEVRRLFHGPMLAVGPFSYAEVAAYSAALFGFVLLPEAFLERLLNETGQRNTAHKVLLVARGTALAFGVLVFGDLASPWWGPIEGDLRQPWLLFFLYASACLGAGWMARRSRQSNDGIISTLALAGAGAMLFALITLLVRYAFHGAAMRAGLRETSFETWTFSAVWAVYGLLTLAVGAARKDISLRGLGLALLLVTTAKVFLFDLSRLEGVVRAASFLALGAILLVAALAARRLGGVSDKGEAAF